MLITGLELPKQNRFFNIILLSRLKVKRKQMYVKLVNWETAKIASDFSNILAKRKSCRFLAVSRLV